MRLGNQKDHLRWNREQSALPYGAGITLRHVIRSDAGGAVEWTAAADAPFNTGVTGVTLDADGKITRLTTVYDGGLYDSTQIGRMAEGGSEYLIRNSQNRRTAMTLKIIGSGFGRTGTMSTKMALEQLGYGPCHHMTEVMGNPAQPAFWKARAEGAELDWEEVFQGYSSQVDFPGASVWQETAIAFPDAKVIHTERPGEEWWASYSKTIGKLFAQHASMPLPPPLADIFVTMDKLLVQGVMGGLGKDTAIAAYRRNNEKVRETIPSERLLVFTPSDGWAPLCAFLGKDVPQGDFPRSNARDDFWALLGGEPAAV